MITKETFAHLIPQEMPDLLGQLNWTSAPPALPDTELDTDHTMRIAIVGQSGVGKKSLCNTLWGWDAVAPSGDTVRTFGRLLLIDLPSDASKTDDFMTHLASTQMIIYVLDASHTLHDADFAWVSRLRATNIPLLIAANKIDLIESAQLKKVFSTLRERLALPIIPLSAKDLSQVHHRFLPAVLKAFPDIAESLAGEITGLRRRVARQLTHRTAVSSVFLSVRAEGDADSQNDLTLLIGLQMRLMRRIGMLYGYRPRGGHGRELVLTITLRFLFRHLNTISKRYPHLQTWMVNSAVALVTTVVVGRFAVLYYGAALPGWMRWL